MLGLALHIDQQLVTIINMSFRDRPALRHNDFKIIYIFKKLVLYIC
tara:strand:- start:292 stop:429 length:138 start_codon:yes stop_codon:yes gene_type:complete